MSGCFHLSLIPSLAGSSLQVPFYLVCLCSIKARDDFYNPVFSLVEEFELVFIFIEPHLGEDIAAQEIGPEHFLKLLLLFSRSALVDRVLKFIVSRKDDLLEPIFAVINGGARLFRTPRLCVLHVTGAHLANLFLF